MAILLLSLSLGDNPEVGKESLLEVVIKAALPLLQSPRAQEGFLHVYYPCTQSCAAENLSSCEVNHVAGKKAKLHDYGLIYKCDLTLTQGTL